MVAFFLPLAQAPRPMWPAFLTALCFAGSGICGQRSAVSFGSLRGNTYRLALSALVLHRLATEDLP